MWRAPLSPTLRIRWVTPPAKAPSPTQPRVARAPAAPNLMVVHQGGPLNRRKNSVSNPDSFTLKRPFVCASHF